MIVVVLIVSIIAAIAVPGFQRYKLRSKTTEALLQLRRIFDSSLAAFYASEVGMVGVVPLTYPPSNDLTPPTSCCSGSETQEAGDAGGAGGGGDAGGGGGGGTDTSGGGGWADSGGGWADSGGGWADSGGGWADSGGGGGGEAGCWYDKGKHKGQPGGPPCHLLKKDGGQAAVPNRWDPAVGVALAAIPLAALAAGGGTTAGGGRCRPDPAVWNTPTWNRLNFSMTEPHYYRYAYCSTGQGSSASFAAGAYGDLDYDGTLSTYERVGGAIAGGGTGGGPGVFIHDDLE